MQQMSFQFNLLLHRSIRYSYRKRTCRCCPTIFCELLLPCLAILLVWFFRYAFNAIDRDLQQHLILNSSMTNSRSCSKDYFQSISSKDASLLEINLVFQPKTNETNDLVLLAQNRSKNIRVRNENFNDNQTDNTIIVRFNLNTNLRMNHQLTYNLIVENYNLEKNIDPIDFSFLKYGHPLLVDDRQMSTYIDYSEWKIFIDSLLVSYQSNRTIDLEIEKNLMKCTSYRNDAMFTSNYRMIGLSLPFIDLVFLIPFMFLLMSLIEEKNAKVKEILKILGIQPILNNLAHAFRSFILLFVCILILAIILKFRSTAYLYNVHFVAVLVSYLILSLQIIALAIFNAQLFNRQLRAILWSITFWIVSINIYSYMTTWSTGIQYLLIFLSPFIASRSIFQQIVLHDLAERDILFFKQIYRFVPIYFCTLIIMILSSIFYWILSWYLEKVRPGEYGIPLEWNFLFKRNYWLPKRIDTEIEMNSQQQSIVRVRHLVKRFGLDKIAVDDVSFDLHENEITSLLGPNGSGKTTIFNCLTGIYSQTSGTISIGNQRNSIGYCPQHDILFDFLTIKEQIEFSTIARGYRKDKERIVSELLRLVNLEDVKNDYCESLSGGMKRRLSLACAFAGETKLIILDEPSSGLDPSNRRSLWNWLRTMKEGKTLLISTHFMEESDALSDRIIILSNGKIKANDTAMNLKEQYGLGYKLIIQKGNGYSTENIYEELSPYLPQITIENDLSESDVVFRTNQQPNGDFLQALKHLEFLKQSNRVKTYGIQNSTIEDAFFRITNENIQIDHQKIEQQCQLIFKDQQLLNGFQFYFSQFFGLFNKRLVVQFRRWLLTLTLVLLPIFYNLLINRNSSEPNRDYQFHMNINSLNPQTILYNSDLNIQNYIQSISSEAKFERRQENITEINEIILQKRSNSPYTYTEIYLAFYLLKPINNAYKIQILSSNLISNYRSLSLASNLFYKLIRNDSQASIQTTLIYKQIRESKMSQTKQIFKLALNFISCYLKFLPISLITDQLLFYFIFFYVSMFLINERKDRLVSLLNISGLHPISYWLFNYLFDLILSVIWFSYLIGIYSIFINSQIEFDLQKLTRKFYSLTILIVLPALPWSYLLVKFFRKDILGSSAIYFLLFLIHCLNIFISLSIITKDLFIRKLIYWTINCLCPTINSQVIITYILLKNDPLCQILHVKDISLIPIGDNTIAYNIVLLIFQTIFYFILLILIDCRVFSTVDFRRKTKLNVDDDDDVRNETHRISNAQCLLRGEVEEDEMDYLIVNNLVKFYSKKKKLAVNHLTFGAKRGEIFGLLGFNGAGKTTTFRIIVGDLSSSEGTVYINGQNVHNRLRSFSHLGYCPQTDCSMEYLTVEDSLYLLARIRGIPSSNIRSLVETGSSLFLLEPYLKNSIHQLSGGTKRRLHTALALIGPPLVAILDEPTTGVDPYARQQMQEIFLNAVKHQLTIVLTSHSMDESERVCNRLGIMVNGQLACLGTIQHLKSKFGHGYTVQIKLRSNTMRGFCSFFQSQMECRMEIQETTELTGLFRIKTATPGELFQLIEENKDRLNIETYIISQTTLEQIFLSFEKGPTIISSI